jgi:hypothetical protein
VSTDAELRAKIRALMAAGTPSRASPTRASAPGHEPDGPCLVCEEPGPQISYTDPYGRVIRLPCGLCT